MTKAYAQRRATARQQGTQKKQERKPFGPRSLPEVQRESDATQASPVGSKYELTQPSPLQANLQRAIGEETADQVPQEAIAVQAKLTIGAPGDRHEQEADRVAREFVRRINAPAGPTESPKEQGKQGTIQRQPQIPVRVSRYVPPSGSAPAGGAMPAKPEFEAEVNSARGGGRQLDQAFRAKAEPVFGADFSGVRVHVDARSDALNRSIQAMAFTTGQDMFFRQGAYQPGTSGGQELLAHELTHVKQQGGGQQQQLNERDYGSKEAVGSRQVKTRVEDESVQRYHNAEETVKMEAVKDTEEDRWTMKSETEKKGQDAPNQKWGEFVKKEKLSEVSKENAEWIRAHAVARRFGGSNQDKNIGLWPKDIEDKWTEAEKKVAGDVDIETDKEYIVGWEEKGDYIVERKLVPPDVLQKLYIDPALKAIQEGFNKNNQTWLNSITKLEDRLNIKLDVSKLESALSNWEAEYKKKTKNNLTREFKEGVERIIASMTMKYDETQQGKNIKPSAVAKANVEPSEEIRLNENNTREQRPKSEPLAERNFKQTEKFDYETTIGLKANMLWQKIVGDDGNEADVFNTKKTKKLTKRQYSLENYELVLAATAGGVEVRAVEK